VREGRRSYVAASEASFHLSNCQVNDPLRVDDPSFAVAGTNADEPGFVDGDHHARRLAPRRSCEGAVCRPEHVGPVADIT
jgi:hypothetical protein